MVNRSDFPGSDSLDRRQKSMLEIGFPLAHSGPSDLKPLRSTLKGNRMPSTQCNACAGAAPGLSAQEQSAIHQLIALGVPIGVLSPANPKFHSGEFRFDGRRLSESSCQVLRRFRRGCAIIMQTGHGIDVIDVDPRNGGSFTFAALSNNVGDIVAHVESPGGGFHLYIASSGHPSVSFGGVDYLAQGKFVYLPGTLRPKYANKGYRWITEPRKSDTSPSAAFPKALAALRPSPPLIGHHLVLPKKSTGGAIDVYGPTGLLALSLRTAAKARNGMRNRTCYSVAAAFAKKVGPDGEALGRLHQVLLAASKSNGLLSEDGASRVGNTITSGIRAGLAMHQES